MEKLTILMAHPDDETIFGWGAWPHAKRIISCSNDIHDHTKRWKNTDRKKALEEVGEILHVPVISLDYNADFSRLPGLTGELNTFVNTVKDLIKDDELVFTHNPWGEYGHLDHIFVHVLAKMYAKGVVFSDVVSQQKWFEVKGWCLSIPEEICEVDRDLYEKCKAVYQKYNCWTWWSPDITEMRLYYG
jgi:LmbE family N-acetylglucosaminyl deacetylase